MAEFYGWPAIEARMGYNRITLRRWILTRGFPVIRRYPPRRLTPPHRPRVYTNDELILRWELGQVGRQRQERLARNQTLARMRPGRNTQWPYKQIDKQVDDHGQDTDSGT